MIAKKVKEILKSKFGLMRVEDDMVLDWDLALDESDFVELVMAFIIIKKLPEKGSLAYIALFWRRLHIFYFRFRLTFAEKIPSWAEKSYMPSYLLAVAIMERIPTP